MNKIKVHCLGPEGTYGHEVVMKVFLNADEIVFHDSNSEILFALEEDEDPLSFGIVPIENSTKGLVTEIVNDFWLPKVDSGFSYLEVVGEFCNPVRHVLAKNNNRKKIKRIFSHPQALGQCAENIKLLEVELGVKIELIATKSTAGSIDKIERPGDAAICSEFAANLRGINIVKRNFNDKDNNQTLFHVLTKGNSDFGLKTHTAILFTLKDEPAALIRALNCISDYGANMHMIHSIPVGIPGKYAFYIEYDENTDSNNGKGIISNLGHSTEDLIIIGSFIKLSEREVLQ